MTHRIDLPFQQLVAPTRLCSVTNDCYPTQDYANWVCLCFYRSTGVYIVYNMSPSTSKMSSEEQRRVELRHKMVFPPLPDEKERKLHVLKFNTTFGQETQISHWTLKRAGPPKDMIAHAMGFAKTIDAVQLAAYNKAVQYRRLLSGTAVTAFDKAMAAYDNTLRPLNPQGQPDMAQAPDRTNYSLQDCLKTFIAQRTTNVARYNQLRGIQAYKKPRAKPAMDCHEWEDYFLLAVEAMEWLSGNDPLPEGDTLTRMYLDSYPSKWISDFEKIHGTNMAGTNIDQITAFMHDRAIEADAANIRNQLKQTSTKASAPKKVRRTAKYDKPQKKTPGRRLQPDDPCPLPGHDHKWKQCYNNIDNPEAHARRKNRGNQKPAAKSNGQNHRQEADDSDDGSHHAHQDDEPSDNEPGFIDGKSNGYRYPAYTDVSFNVDEDSHHLDCFTLQDLLPKAKKFNKPGPFSTRSVPKQPKSSGRIRARNASNPVVTELQKEVAVDRMTRSIMDPESDLVGDNICFSNNDIVPDVSSQENAVRTVPSSIAVVAKINGLESQKPLNVLFDPCSTYSHIYESALPKGCRPSRCIPKRIKLLDTVSHADQVVKLEDIVLPEFSPTRHINKPLNCLVSKGQSRYDIIFGDDFLKRVQIDPLPSQRIVKWMDLQIPYRETTTAQDKFRRVQQMYLQATELQDKSTFSSELDPDSVIDECCHTATILESK